MPLSLADFKGFANYACEYVKTADVYDVKTVNDLYSLFFVCHMFTYVVIFLKFGI